MSEPSEQDEYEELLDEQEEEQEWEDEEDEEWIGPENCSMGSFSPGTEECEFCPCYELCSELFKKGFG